MKVEAVEKNSPRTHEESEIILDSFRLKKKVSTKLSDAKWNCSCGTWEDETELFSDECARMMATVEKQTGASEPFPWMLLISFTGEHGEP